MYPDQVHNLHLHVEAVGQGERVLEDLVHEVVQAGVEVQQQVVAVHADELEECSEVGQLQRGDHGGVGGLCGAAAVAVAAWRVARVQQRVQAGGCVHAAALVVVAVAAVVVAEL